MRSNLQLKLHTHAELCNPNEIVYKEKDVKLLFELVDVCNSLKAWRMEANRVKKLNNVPKVIKSNAVVGMTKAWNDLYKILNSLPI